MESIIYKLKRRLRYEYLKRFENPATLKTKMGTYRVPIGVSDPISRDLFLHGEFELDLIQEAMGLLRGLSGRPKGKGTILDIGANNGVISIGMLETGEIERAIAIEPEPQNFAFMKENIKLNGLEDKIYDINCALSDKKTSLTFELSDSNYGDHRVRIESEEPVTKDIFNESGRPVITVQGEILDELIKTIPQNFTDDIAVFWIDVQGYEGYVFKGARELLATGVPVVSEIWPYGIKRAGMDMQEFNRLVSEIWTSFWVKRQRQYGANRFIRYPIVAFTSFLEELGEEGGYDNVIFTRE